VPRFYTLEFEAQTIAAASGDYDLFELAPADDKPIEVVEFVLGQSSELGDAAEEQLRLRVIRGHTTSGNGSATTPRPGNPNDAAAGAACETVGSTIASSGTAINLWSDTMNVRAGYQWGPRPQGMGLWCSQAETLLVVRLMAAVADDLTLSGTLGFWEYP
jgi:hypothetical protein